jgi:hypothetical protein
MLPDEQPQDLRTYLYAQIYMADKKTLKHLRQNSSCLSNTCFNVKYPDSMPSKYINQKIMSTMLVTNPKPEPGLGQIAGTQQT